MLRSIAPLLFMLIGSLSAFSQTLSLADLKGRWYFHQHFVDSSLFADSDTPTPFPVKDYELMSQSAAAIPGAQVPDSASFAAILQQNDENYRQYRIDFKGDSTYVTELATGMSKWLPSKGRLMGHGTDGGLQLLDGNGKAITTIMEVKEGELYLKMAGPLNSTLVFRRKQP